MGEKTERTEWHVLGTGVNKLFVREWMPSGGSAKAVICLAHGHGEHGERYRHVAEQLAAFGYTLVAFDHYGHGRSEGKRGHMLSMDAATDDLALVLEQCCKRHPGLPLFLYGHSMGGNIALNCAIRLKPPIRGLIVTSPWLRLAFKPPAAKEWLGRRLAALMPALSMSTGLKEEQLFRQGSVPAMSMRGDSLSHTAISAKAYTELQAGGEWALRHAAELHVPLLLLHGTNDTVTSFQASEQLAERLEGRCEWRPWDGGLHELHNDLEGRETIDVIADWLERQLR